MVEGMGGILYKIQKKNNKGGNLMDFENDKFVQTNRSHQQKS
jgi:hypothetical protein